MTSFINIKLLVSYLMILTLNFAVFEINLAIPFYDYICLVVIQLLSRVQLFATPWTAAHQASLSFTIFQSLHKLMSIELVVPSSHLIFCRPLLLPLSIFPSIRVFSNELALCMVARVLEFQLQHQSFQWIFRTDFLEEGLVESPCSPRDPQESSSTPQFKSINSSALSFLHSLDRNMDWLIEDSKSK